MLLRPGNAATKYSVSREALRGWARSGNLTVHKTPGGHHRYDSVEIERLLNISKENAMIESLVSREKEG